MASLPTAKCDKELRREDGSKDLFGVQHPRCVNVIQRSAWPARCASCHAVDAGSKSRCEGTIEDKKSIYCPKHASMDGNAPRGSSAGAAGAAVAAGGVSLTGV